MKRDYAAYFMVVGFGIVLLVCFIVLWIYGEFKAYEYNHIVLGFETAVSMIIFSLGVERLHNLRKRIKMLDKLMRDNQSAIIIQKRRGGGR